MSHTCGIGTIAGSVLVPDSLRNIRDGLCSTYHIIDLDRQGAESSSFNFSL